MIAGDIVADHRRGLRGELRQHLGHLHQADQVSGDCRAVLHRLRVQNIYCAGAGIEVDIVAGGKVHDRFSAASVEIKVFPDRGKRAIYHSSGNLSDIACQFRATVFQQAACFRIRDSDTGLCQELIGFFKNAVYGLRGKDLE